jgi:SAM-dependent methyltransferase
VQSAATAAKAPVYYEGLNQHLLDAVPADARTILEVGCAQGRLGAALKERDPGRRVFGVERVPAMAGIAAGRLDRVFTIDVERDAPDLPPGSVDCILFGDVLEHLVDPLGALRRLAPLLSPGGRVLCSVPNVQHHSVITALLRGEFQYQESGLLDSTHLRFFTWSSFMKLLLDAGLAPRLLGGVAIAAAPALLQAMRPLLDHLGVPAERAGVYLSGYQWTIEGTPLGWTALEESPLSFVACVNDEAQLADNLAASPCFRAGSPHELITVRGAPSAADGLNGGIERAKHDIVVLVHQDVYLPAGWPARFLEQWRLAERRAGPVGVAGLYGASHDPAAPGGVVEAGHVLDRHTLRRGTSPLPARVQGLDELLLAVPRTTPLRFDPTLGFHFYGTDLACQARAVGLAAVVVDAPAFHNSQTGDQAPPAFHESGRVFKARWKASLPIATPCALVR